MNVKLDLGFGGSFGKLGIFTELFTGLKLLFDISLW